MILVRKLDKSPQYKKSTCNMKSKMNLKWTIKKMITLIEASDDEATVAIEAIGDFGIKKN